MNNKLALIYLSILVTLLVFIAVGVFRQVFKTHRRERSFSNLRRKLEKKKGNIQDYYTLASIYSEKKLYSQAIRLFQKAIKIATDDDKDHIFLIYNGLGYTYFAQEQYDLAIRQYKEAIKYKPDYVKALNNLAHAYEKKTLIAQALETYEETLKYDSGNVVAKRRAESLRRLVSV
ncbi:tetratricopeptide repeat protein [Richelia intracellularis]|nr:tetratricopeptide repeat protein [Richelia intracellularis]HAE06047.1 tetratricopeptide repeat protein [Richelia sp.]